MSGVDSKCPSPPPFANCFLWVLSSNSWLAFPYPLPVTSKSLVQTFVWSRAKTDKVIVCLADNPHSVTVRLILFCTSEYNTGSPNSLGVEILTVPEYTMIYHPSCSPLIIKIANKQKQISWRFSYHLTSTSKGGRKSVGNLLIFYSASVGQPMIQLIYINIVNDCELTTA